MLVDVPHQPGAAAPGWKLVRHLEWVDGPLVSHVRTSSGAYLRYRADEDERFVRWLYVPASEREILDASAGFTDLRVLFLQATAGVVVEDVPLESGGAKVGHLFFVGGGCEYMTEVGSRLDPKQALPNGLSALVPSWDDSDIGRFGQILRDVRAWAGEIVGATSPDEGLPSLSAPFRGGFSFVHFFKALRRVAEAGGQRLPFEGAVASPGYCAWHDDSPAMVRAQQMLAATYRNRKVVRGVINEARSYIREKKLNKREGAQALLTMEDEKVLSTFATTILSLAGGSFAAEATEQVDPFRRVKIVIAQVWRLLQLLDWVEGGASLLSPVLVIQGTGTRHLHTRLQDLEDI